MSGYVTVAEAARDRGLTKQAILYRVHKTDRVRHKTVYGLLLVNLSDVRKFKKMSGGLRNGQHKPRK